MDDWEDDNLVPCPHCGASVYEDAAICPVCDQYVDDAPPTSRSAMGKWTTVIVLITIIAFVLPTLLTLFNLLWAR